MGHARLSPSQFFRAQLCPGSPREESKYPDTDNEHSLRGTAAHTVGEYCISDNENPADYLDQEISVIGADGLTVNKIQMGREDIDAVSVYLDYVNMRKQQLGECRQHIEQTVNPGGWLGREDLWGTADCILMADKTIEIIDYKHGFTRVEVEDNPQLLLYAIGACTLLDWTQSDQTEIIKMTIVQPRSPHPKGPVRSVELRAYELFGMLDTFRAQAAATDDPNAKLNPGEKQCKYCKHKANCPAVAQQAMDVFQPSTVEISGTQVAADWEQNLLRPIEVLDTAALFKALDNEGLVTSWFKAIRDRLTELAKRREISPVDFGYKLVQAQTRRKWGVDDEELIKKLSNLRDISNKDEPRKIKKAEVTQVKPIAIGECEKRIRPLVSERQWKGVEKLIIKPEGAPVLAPLTDPREPIKEYEDVFQPINQEPAPEAPGW